MNLEYVFRKFRPTVVTDLKSTRALPICGAPSMSVRQRYLYTPPSGSRRCERRPHHQASLRALAKRYGINPKTVAKWKKRGSVADLPTGPKDAASTVLSIEEEAVIVAFRRHTLLPLDDCLYALQLDHPASDVLVVAPLLAAPRSFHQGCPRSKARPRPSGSSRPILSATSRLPLRPRLPRPHV